jgi:hypothetical protein
VGLYVGRDCTGARLRSYAASYARRRSARRDSALVYDRSARSDSAKVLAFKAASSAGRLFYWTAVPLKGARADAVAAVWFIELLLLFHIKWELNEQNNNPSCWAATSAITRLCGRACWRAAASGVGRQRALSWRAWRSGSGDAVTL